MEKGVLLLKITLNKAEKEILLFTEKYGKGNVSSMVNTLLYSVFFNNNNLDFNGKSITIKNLLKHAQNTKNIDVEKNLGNIAILKPDFVTNFNLLEKDLQESLILFFKKLNIKYDFSYGTVKNLSAYDNKGNFQFYINLSNSVGQKNVYDFLSTFSNYNAHLKNNISSLPNNCVFISCWEHLKNSRNTASPSNTYLSMLKILNLPTNTECFEVNSNDLLKLISQI